MHPKTSASSPPLFDQCLENTCAFSGVADGRRQVTKGLLVPRWDDQPGSCQPLQAFSLRFARSIGCNMCQGNHLSNRQAALRNNHFTARFDATKGTAEIGFQLGDPEFLAGAVWV